VENSLLIYQVYVYEFSDCTAYVGLTKRPVKRHIAHYLHGKVAKKIKLGLLDRFVVLHKELDSASAKMLEQDEISSYQASGWSLLNSNRGGSLGQIGIKYSYLELVVLARDFKTRTEFGKVHYGPYQAARRLGWLDRLAEEVGWPKHVDHWTFEECLKAASGFSGRGAWSLSNKGYMTAYCNGWLDRISNELGWKFRKTAVVTP
jgi:predicted GIY-YIG superfamily endonuclease